MIDLALVMTGVVTQYPSPEHPAWDLACRTGRPVHAYNSGTLRTYEDSRLGKVVVIDGPEGRSLYAHLHEVVHPPGPVDRGEEIAYCGNTGSWSTGPHLHFEFEPSKQGASHDPS